MQLLQAGILIKSTAALAGTFFDDSIILISSCTADGAIGFIINQPFGRNLNELEEFRHSRSFPLYKGGPVDTAYLFFIHKRPDIVDGGMLIKDDTYTGGNFNQALTGINNKSLSKDDIKIFVGYCGWDTGELEAEIEEGSWEIISNIAIFNL